MTYIDLINDFWQQYDRKGINPPDALLYFYLLRTCNRQLWATPFELPNKIACIELNMTERELINARSRLICRGLVKWIKGDRNLEAPKYDLPRLHIATSQTTEAVSSKMSANTYKPSAPMVRESVAEAETAVISRPPAPSLDEVKRVFLGHRADQRLSNWMQQAENFLDYYSGIGWRTPSGAKITEWKHFVPRWISREENEENKRKNQTYNGNNANWRPDETFRRRQLEQTVGQMLDNPYGADVDVSGFY